MHNTLLPAGLKAALYVFIDNLSTSLDVLSTTFSRQGEE
jgi:hypothetical protein